MEKVKVKHKADCTIITYKLEKTHQISKKYMDILNGNVIDGLLPLELRSGIGGRSIRVQVKNSIDLASYLKSGISVHEFISMIRKMIGAIHACEVHGLRPSHLDLNPERTFYSDHGIILLIYRPMIILEKYSNIPEFLHQLGCLYEAGDSHEYKKKYLELLADKGRFDVFWFEEYITSLENEWLQQKMNYSGGSSNSKHFSDNDDTISFNHDDSTKPFFENSLDLQQELASFIVVRSNQRVSISHFPYSIGRKSDLCDYAIPDNPYIGRKHILLEKKNNQFFVKDNDSRNGTKLNGSLIAPQQEYELQNNSILELGNEKIQFFC